MQRERFFPAELMHDLPYIAMTSDQLLTIEQHRGIISCRPDCVVFRTSSGDLTVLGEELSVSRYSACEASLSGRIHAVQFRDAQG